MDFVQAVGICFLRFSGPRIDCGIAGGVFTLEIVLLLCKRENATNYTLDVFESVATELARPDLVQPTLYVEGSRIFEPNLLAEPLPAAWSLCEV